VPSSPAFEAPPPPARLAASRPEQINYLRQYFLISFKELIYV
jgi:hypothetical protein